MNWTTRKDAFFVSVLTVLGIVCFPVNPLVLTGIITAPLILPLFILGWIVWACGMVLVMAPIIMFPRKGGVARGKSFVNTTKLVKTGIYGIVRHPQYLGGIFSIFIACFLLYPHCLFAILGITGAVITYLSSREEDKKLIEKFGDDYSVYMREVPGMNIFAGIWRAIQHHST